eukprot:8019224-Pyramimonas_sp.AAC.1
MSSSSGSNAARILKKRCPCGFRRGSDCRAALKIWVVEPVISRGSPWPEEHLRSLFDVPSGNAT